MLKKVFAIALALASISCQSGPRGEVFYDGETLFVNGAAYPRKEACEMVVSPDGDSLVRSGGKQYQPGKLIVDVNPGFTESELETILSKYDLNFRKLGGQSENVWVIAVKPMFEMQWADVLASEKSLSEINVNEVVYFESPH